MKRTLVIEICIYAILMVAAAAVLIWLDAFDRLYIYTRLHEDWELDELLAALPGIAFFFALFAVRMSMALRKEVKARQAAEAKALDSLRIKHDFMALVSHEMRTPVNGIISAMNIARESKNPDERREFLNLAENSAKALSRLVDDVITFARMDQDRPQMWASAIHPASLVHDAADIIQAEADGKGIEVRKELDASLPSVILSFDGPLRQIFYNLTGNALKFTRQGSITLGLAFSSLGDNTGLLHLTVADTGEGIPEKDLGHIFEPYYQVEQKGPKRAAGLGLGLSLVNRVLQLLGGDIEVESKVGHGSRFHVSIPVQLPVQST